MSKKTMSEEEKKEAFQARVTVRALMVAFGIGCGVVVWELVGQGRWGWAIFWLAVGLILLFLVIPTAETQEDGTKKWNW